jgi:hypothetical protein
LLLLPLLLLLLLLLAFLLFPATALQLPCLSK